MVLLNNAGLSTLQALQSATLNPAKYLHKTDSLGTIAPNKYADILLLSENPLSDITNTRKIEGLILNGSYYTKNDLEGLKQKAREASEKINKESGN
ncbi:MAG TPA: amidohydrolase family protein [Chitinophagaceae bacterium]|nr:amidohydrolase family protein [Chitinophagaceae bacterium]